MDPPPNQQAAEVNLTRALEALSPYINNPRHTLMRIEVFVLVAVGLLFLQLLLGSIRRWCGNWFVQGALWVAYTASFPLITYTLGQMVSSPIKNALYPLWAVFLFWTAGCTHSIIAYDLEDNKSWKRHLFELIQYFLYLHIIERLLRPSSNRTFFKQVKVKNQQMEPIDNAITWLIIVLLYANIVRVIAGWMVTKSAPSKFVADYMRKQAADAKGNQSESFNPDPVTMKGYKYLVCWPPRKEIPLSEALPLFSFDPITIDKIYEMEIDDSLVNSNKGGLGVKDLCLSFALSHLLKRRYFEMECAEANCQETLKFVLEGLLLEKEEDKSYTRAFQIIEVELGFLYDFFFTKYATLFHMEVTYLVMAVLKLISISWCGVVLLRNFPIVRTLDPVIEVGTRRIDVIITIIIMVSFFLVEALQLVLYMTSDWATISLACLCIRRSNSKWIWILSLIRFIRRFKVIKLRGYWQNKMGQSSVIASSMHFLPVCQLAKAFPDLLVVAVNLSVVFILTGLFHSMIFSGKLFIQVPDPVKSEIVSCLKEYKVDHPLSNGQRALSRHGILENFSWTLKNPSQTSIMLVWHIATEYCSISLPSEGGKEGGASKPSMFVWHQGCLGLWKNKKESLGDQQVATTLSRYCAYLMSFVPDLLPGNSTDTLFILKGVLEKANAKKLLQYKREARKEISQEPNQDSERSSNEEAPTMIHDSRGNDDDTIEVTDSNDVNNTDEIINVHDFSDENNTDNNIVHDSSADSNDNNNTDEIINVHDSSADNNTKDDDIFTQGLKLGRQLEEIQDEDARWRLMAEFWAETIVYIAPSNNAKAHMERLAQGGEFLTHVWALLTHAGILQRGNKEMETQDIPIINV